MVSTDLEKVVLAATPRTKRRELNWLFLQRENAAVVIAEMGCWGASHLPSLDTYMVNLEDRIARVINDPLMTVVLMAEYVVHDSELIHPRGRPPAGFSCLVCQTGGEYSVEMALSRIPQAFGMIDLEL